MKKLIFSFLLISFITNDFFSQTNNLSDENKRSLFIGIINKTQSLESSINVQRTRRINSKLKISNDLYWSNKPDTFLLYKDYLKLIKSKCSDYSTNFFINKINKPKFSNNTFFTDVYVTRIISQNYENFTAEIIDTIAQKIVFSSKIDVEENWNIKIQNISTLNIFGRVISLNINGDKDYFNRYGAKFFFQDSIYNIPPSDKKKNIFYFAKDLNKPIKFSNNNYSNYYNMYEEHRPLDFNMPRIAVIKLKNNGVGRYGYFEIDLGKDIFNNINSFLDSDLNIENLDNSIEFQNNFNTSLKYNLYFPSPIRAYFGFGISLSNFNFISTFTDFNQSYDDFDPDGSLYKRTISFSNFQESLSAEFISIPFSIGLNLEIDEVLNIDFKSFNNFHFLLDLSYSPSLMKNTNNNSSRTADVLYSGFYENFFNLYISENGVYDFGNYTVSNSNNIQLKNNISHNFSIGLKSYFNRLVLSSSFNYLWINNDFFNLEENSFLSRNNENLNSYFSTIEKSRISMFSINFKVGLVLIKKKDEKF